MKGAEADFFRPRWSQAILDEAERTIERILVDRGVADAAEPAALLRPMPLVVMLKTRFSASQAAQQFLSNQRQPHHALLPA